MKKVPLCVSPPSLCSCLSLKLLYWVKNKRKQTFIFSVVMLVNRRTLALLCSASVSWHPPCSDFLLHHLPKSWPAAGPQPALPVTSSSRGEGAPGTCCLSCANNINALGGADFLKNIQIHFPNGFSCWFSGMVTAIQTKCLPVRKSSFFFFSFFFKGRHVFISRSDGFANFLEHLLQGSTCWYQTRGLGIQFVLVLGTICSCPASSVGL